MPDRLNTVYPLIFALMFGLCLGAGCDAADLESTSLSSLGYKHLAAGRFREAVAVLGAAVRRDPASIELRRYLCHALLRSGMPAEAAKSMQWVVESGGADFSDLSVLGDCYMLSGRPAEAFRAYSSSLKMSPDFERSCGGLVRALVALGDEDGALRMCERLESGSASPETKRSLARLRAEIEIRRSRGGAAADLSTPGGDRG